MAKFEDLYATLGLKVDGDPSQISIKSIEHAFKKTARKYHPDKTKNDPKHSGRFEASRVAVEVLRNPEQREKYDETFRARMREELRLQQEDEKTKRMRQDLEFRELNSAINKGPGSEAMEFQKLQRETLEFTQSTKNVLPSNIKTFSLEEHLARERVILKACFQTES